MKCIIFVLGVVLVGAIDDETLKGWTRLDDSTWLNPATGEMYQPETLDDMMFADNEESRKRNTPYNFRTWTDGIVPYTFGEQWASDEHFKQSVRKGMDGIEAKTCVKFVPWTNQPHRINIVRNKGCTSFVGMQTWAYQDVNLAGGCLSFGIVMHELSHALGFNHEHERADREGFISVNLTNVQPDYRRWLGVSHQKLSEFGYDVDSVMHYGKYAFAQDYRYPVIIQLKDFDKGRIGQRSHLSIKDVKEINQLYKCDPNKVLPTTTTTTKGTGVGTVLSSCNFESNWCRIAVSGSTQRWRLRRNVGGNAGLCAGWNVASNEIQTYQRSSTMSIGSYPPATEACLSFRYLIQTSGVIHVKLGGGVVRALSNADSGWLTVKTSLGSANAYRQVELAVNILGNSYGQINIDDVVLSSGRC